MAADAGTRVDVGCAVVGTRLADVVVRNGCNLRAVLVAIRSTLSGTSTELASSLAVYKRDKGSEVYGVLHSRFVC
jgi:hypothetical protein